MKPLILILTLFVCGCEKHHDDCAKSFTDEQLKGNVTWACNKETNWKWINNQVKP
jgi:hypothetical protein